VGDFRVVLNETSVEVAEAEEGLEVFEFSGAGPIRDSEDFGRVHLDTTVGNNYPEILNRGLIEEAFFRFKVEVMSVEACKD
jgi:hypothetical protein